MYSADQYAQMMVAALPPGIATPAPGSRKWQYLHGIARSLARLDRRVDDLLDEALPYSSAEMLTDWERVAGLPDPCSGEAETISERRDQVVARLTATGGQSIAYYTAVAAALGYEIAVEEHFTLTCVDPCDGCLNPWPWPEVWTVHAPDETVRELPCDGASDEPLRTWGNHPLECTLSRWKPAHTTVLFAYGDAA